MTNAELIKALRHCGKGGDVAERCLPCDYYDREPWFEAALVNDAADALETAEKRIADLEKSYSWKAYAALEESIEGYKTRIAELEDDLRNSTISNPERFKIYGYTVKDLLLFADMCKRNDVKESDLKQAAWNLELAARAYHNATIENFRTWEDEKGIHSSARYVPNFEKAFEEMMPNCGAKMKGEAYADN